jgi:hypothetical protein
MPHSVLSAAGLAVFSFICNLPLGRWRATVRKFSANWFLAVHLSIPLIIYLRLKLGLSAWFIPISLGSAVVGQFLGGSAGFGREEQGS